MNGEFKPVTVEDFGLSEAEISELVLGAQKFLAPGEDPADGEIQLTVPETE